MIRRQSHLLLLATFVSFIGMSSAKSGWGEACDQSNTHLDSDTWALVTDCDATTYCNANGTCAYKGCRKDIYPYGYNGVAYDKLPPLCGDGSFCPDEADACQNQIPIGQNCQKDRDDECAPPTNYKDLAGYLNVNGTVCLNYTCYVADITLGQTCVVENTPYVGYADNGNAYAFIISRDNCANGLYCDGTALQCMKSKAFGTTCSGNKECLSYNCQSNNKCGKAADEQSHPGVWVYPVIGLSILALVLAIMVSLWLYHRKVRKENQIMLEQYYNEQLAYRQSIMSMSHAKNSLLSLPANTTADAARQSLLGEDAFAYTSATDPNNYNHHQQNPNGLLPPNMRRESSAAWSEADSEVLLMPHQNKGGQRWRG